MKGIKNGKKSVTTMAVLCAFMIGFSVGCNKRNEGSAKPQKIEAQNTTATNKTGLAGALNESKLKQSTTETADNIKEGQDDKFLNDVVKIMQDTGLLDGMSNEDAREFVKDQMDLLSMTDPKHLLEILVVIITRWSKL